MVQTDTVYRVRQVVNGYVALLSNASEPIQTFTHVQIAQRLVVFCHQANSEKPSISLLVNNQDTLGITVTFSMFRRNSFGAPTPLDTYSILSGGQVVEFQVKMYKKVAIQPGEDQAFFMIGLSASGATDCRRQNSIQSGFQLIVDADYYQIYRLRVALSDLINTYSNTIVSNGAIYKSTINLYMTYSIVSDSCYTVSFKRKYLFDIGLTVTNLNSALNIIQTCIDDQDHVEVTCEVTCDEPVDSFDCINSQDTSHAFNVHKKSTTTTKSIQGGIKYQLVLESLKPASTSLFNASYALMGKLSSGSQVKLQDFVISYQYPYDSALRSDTVVDIYSDASFTTSNKTLFNTRTDRLFVRVQPSDASSWSTLSNYVMSPYNVYLCCSTSVTRTMPVHNVDAALYGCTKNDPSSLWFQSRLIQEGTPISDSLFSVKIHTDLTSSSSNGLVYGFSFNLSPLVDKNSQAMKKCFLHVESQVKQGTTSATYFDPTLQILKDVVSVVFGTRSIGMELKQRSLTDASTLANSISFATFLIVTN